MAVEPGPIDGIAPDARPFVSGRQRIIILLAVIGAGAALMALTQFLGMSHPPHQIEHNISTGLPWHAAPPAPVVAPKPLALPRQTVTPVMQASTPTEDAVTKADIFSSAGSAYEPPFGGGRIGAGANGENGGKQDEFSVALTPSDLGAPARAKLMPHPALTIAAGTLIPCTLTTAINSELMGFVGCVTPAPVYGADGTTILMDKGTSLFGEIRSGLQRGQNRLFILWVRARTPQNITVTLSSPAADELGRAGVTGGVDTHFWPQFWAAALYSVIEYGPQLVATALQNQNHNGTTINTTFLTPQQQLANTILDANLRIPPTLEKNQGDGVSIYVARDLDFSGVYDLKVGQ